MKWSSIIL